MTRIALDTDAAVRTLGHLEISEQGMGHAVGELRRPHLGLFPPRVLAMLVTEQAQLSMGLAAGGGAVHAQRVALARRLAGFVAADGGPVDQAVLDAILSAFGLVAPVVDERSMRILGGGARMLDELGDILSVHELALFGMVRFAERGLPGFERMPMKYFHSEYERILGKSGMKVLGGVGVGLSLYENYNRSGAATPYGKAFSSFLGTGVVVGVDRVFGGVPVGSTIDLFSGGFFSGTQDATAVLTESVIRMMTGDGAGAQATLEAWSAAALRGDKGWAVQGLAVVGDTTGGWMYDGAQHFQDAGEAFGGALYDAGHAANENAHTFKNWLGL